MKKNNKKYGFTLAEVLFALVIVGAISALTIPNVVGNLNKKMLAAQAKKTQLSIINAVSQLILDQKAMRFEIVASSFTPSLMFTTISSKKADAFPDDIVYFNLAGKKFPIPGEDDGAFGLTDNGTSFFTTLISEKGPNACLGVVAYDTNGPDKPNIAGRDLFVTYITKKGDFVDYETCKTLQTTPPEEEDDPDAPEDETPDQKILRYCTTAEDYTKLSECLLLLERNNWKMDYEYTDPEKTNSKI